MNNVSAYEKGRSDYEKGRVLNPFMSFTASHREWEQGYNDAYTEEIDYINEKYEIVSNSNFLYTIE